MLHSYSFNFVEVLFNTYRLFMLNYLKVTLFPYKRSSMV